MFFKPSKRGPDQTGPTENREQLVTVVIVAAYVVCEYLYFFRPVDSALQVIATSIREVGITTLLGLVVLQFMRSNRYHDRLTKSLSLYKMLVKFESLSGSIESICHNVEEIRKRSLPKHVDDLLHEKLAEYDKTVSLLRSGHAELLFDEALRHSKQFFKNSTGQIFTTVYGDYLYWTGASAGALTKANQRTLKRRPGSITRVFILPPSGSNGTATMDNVIQLILDQVQYGVKVYTIGEREIGDKFKVDVGIFFEASADPEPQFVSQWETKSFGKIASWYFNPYPMTDFKNLHDAFLDLPGIKGFTLPLISKFALPAVKKAQEAELVKKRGEHSQTLREYWAGFNSPLTSPPVQSQNQPSGAPSPPEAGLPPTP